MSEFIPNSFQVPNIYIDLFLAYLTPEEFKVLMYTIRRILGFENKRGSRQDRISLSQFSGGIVAADGRALDEGVLPEAARLPLSARYGLLI